MASQGQGYKKLHEYLGELADDPAQLQAYVSDRKTAVAASGLHPDHQQLLLNDDLEGVKAAVLQELGKPISAVRIFAIC
jgi:hypothetical protein